MNWQPEALSAIVAAVVAALGAWVTMRKSRADAITAATQAATALYKELCASQQARIETLTKRIQALETEKDELVKRYTAEMDMLEGQLADLREALSVKQGEIEKLKGRVTELEAENAKLREELDHIRQERNQRRPSGR